MEFILEVFMYQTIVKGKRLFQTSSQGYGDPITTFSVTDQGETPVSLVNIALAACVAMCIQGYYASQEGNKTMSVQVESQLENQHSRLNIGIGEEVALEKQKEILAYIEQKCKVKALLKEDLMIETRFFVLESVE